MRTIDPDAFVATVKPVLEAKDLQGLLNTCKARWTAEQIVSLLACDHCDARKVAALALAMVGCHSCLAPLAKQLKDADPMVNQMAEHAIWSIWFRGGTPEANHQLARGAQAMHRRDVDHAIKHFDRAIELSPTFPEAYNQRALARYSIDQFEGSIADSLRVVEQMPIHFGAWAGMGHCHAHLGRYEEAVRCYEKAIEINPHLECIREAIEELRERAND